MFVIKYKVDGEPGIINLDQTSRLIVVHTHDKYRGPYEVHATRPGGNGNAGVIYCGTREKCHKVIDLIFEGMMFSKCRIDINAALEMDEEIERIKRLEEGDSNVSRSTGQGE